MPAIALFLALLAAPASKHKADDPATKGRALAARIQRFYQRTKDFSADFTQRYNYVAMGRTDVSSGTVKVKKPGLVRWDYVAPVKKSLVLEGKTLWIYLPEDQTVQVNRSFGGDQLSSALTFLWGKGDLLTEFEPKAIAHPDGLPEGDGLELLPKKPLAGIERLVFVVGKDGQVKASVVTNPQGDVNQLVFEGKKGSKTDAPIPDSVFHFEPPKGAYVQEL